MTKECIYEFLALGLPEMPETPMPSRKKTAYSSKRAITRPQSSRGRGYKDPRDPMDLRAEILRLKKRLEQEKRDSKNVRTQFKRLQEKMRENDKNLARILNSKIKDKKGHYQGGLALALRSEKSLVRSLMARIKDLENQVEAKKKETNYLRKKIKEMPSMRHAVKRLEAELAQARRLLLLRVESSGMKYEEEINRVTARFHQLQREHEIVSTQHMAAIKALTTLNRQQNVLRNLKKDVSEAVYLAHENEILRSELASISKN